MHLDGCSWPIRWARAIACHSVVGLSCGSQMTTTDAAWMFRPTPPATIWRHEHRTLAGGREVVDHLPAARAAGTDPVSGPKTRPGQAAATGSSTSRK